MIDQINKLPEDGLKSSPETSRYTENKGNSSLHVGPPEVRYLTLDVLKCFFLWTILKETTMNESLNVRL